jgi:hypothetical protein
MIVDVEKNIMTRARGWKKKIPERNYMSIMKLLYIIATFQASKTVSL